MPTMTAYAAGTFCWPELGTTDTAAAKKFYSELFDWKTESMPIPGGEYTMIKSGEHEVAALYQLMDEQKKAGVPPHWLSYVAVDDVAATVKKIEAAGGKLLMGPHEVKPDGKTLVGEMAAVQDPQGAAFALWKAGTHCGATLVNEHGSLVWNELITTDVAAARKFYLSVFGWGTDEMPMPEGAYTVVKVGDRPNGGIMARPREMGNVPPNWLVYFAVDDCKKRLEKAKKLGGKLLDGPRAVPGVGTLAFFMDPQGAAFAIMEHEKKA